jgi:hypothetical protein
MGLLRMEQGEGGRGGEGREKSGSVVREASRLHRAATTTFEQQRKRGNLTTDPISPNMQHQQRRWVKHDDIFDPLRKVKPRTDFQILRFVSLADDFDNGLRDERHRFFLFVGSTAENGGIRTLQGPIGEAHIDIRYMETGAPGDRVSHLHTGFNRRPYPVYLKLVPQNRVGFPDGQPADYFEANTEFIGMKQPLRYHAPS